MFLNPVVPGSLVYLFMGIIICRRAQASQSVSYALGVVVCCAMCFVPLDPADLDGGATAVSGADALGQFESVSAGPSLATVTTGVEALVLLLFSPTVPLSPSSKLYTHPQTL